MGIVIVFMFLALIAIFIRLGAGSADHDRIHAELQSKGATNIQIEWSPLGKGWFGEKNDRIYLVTYTDIAGGVHRTWCKTSMFGGVYFSDHEVVDEAKTEERVATEQQRRVDGFHVDTALQNGQTSPHEATPQEQEAEMLRRRLRQVESEAAALRAKLDNAIKSESDDHA